MIIVNAKQLSGAQKRPKMDIIHALVALEDIFSGCKNQKIATVSQTTFEKMKKGIGSTFNQFDTQSQISYTWRVIDVRQAIESDYKSLV